MTKKFINLSILFFLLTAVFYISCCQQKAAWKGTIEEVDGVTVIKNPKEPMYEEEVLSLEEELSIGEAEGQAEYIFSLPTSIAVDDKESIYVLDLKESHTKVFDKKGVEFPKYFPPLLATTLAGDEERRIFIRTYEKGEDGVSYYFDVFDAERRYITKVPLGHRLQTSIVWKNHKLYTTEEDEEAYQYVKRYKVTWKI